MNRNDYLMHYGVKGMKWGVRHEPERVGGLRRFRTDANGGSNSRRGLTDKQKTAAKMAAGAALVVGGSVLAYKMNKRLVATGGRATKSLANKQAMKIAARDPRIEKTARNYYKYTIGSNGRRVLRSTSGRLTGHSQMVNRRGAAEHKVNFYRNAYIRRNNEVNSINPKAYDWKRNELHSQMVNAQDNIKLMPNSTASSRSDLWSLKRYRRP